MLAGLSHVGHGKPLAFRRIVSKLDIDRPFPLPEPDIKAPARQRRYVRRFVGRRVYGPGIGNSGDHLRQSALQRLRGIGHGLACGCSQLSAGHPHAVAFRLLQQRQFLGIEMLPKQCKKRLLVVVPAKAVFRMTDLKSIKMELAEETLVSVAVAAAKDVGRSIALIAAALNDAASAEQRKAGLGRVCRFHEEPRSHERKARCRNRTRWICAIL